MKLQLIARRGHAPVAVLVETRLKDEGAVLEAHELAMRLLGGRAELSTALSLQWGCTVFGTPEFVRWYRAQDPERRPDREDVIFLEVLNG